MADVIYSQRQPEIKILAESGGLFPCRTKAGSCRWSFQLCTCHAVWPTVSMKSSADQNWVGKIDTCYFLECLADGFYRCCKRPISTVSCSVYTHDQSKLVSMSLCVCVYVTVSEWEWMHVPVCGASKKCSSRVRHISQPLKHDLHLTKTFDYHVATGHPHIYIRRAVFQQQS